MLTSLYRAFNAENQLLYIGITNHYVGRISEHSNTSAWYSQATHFTIEHYPTRREAWDAETKAIQTENPLHNKAKNPEYAMVSKHLLRIKTFDDAHHRSLTKFIDKAAEIVPNWDLDVSPAELYGWLFHWFNWHTYKGEDQINCAPCEKINFHPLTEDSIIAVDNAIFNRSEAEGLPRTWAEDHLREVVSHVN